jgi:hypothetical protein
MTTEIGPGRKVPADPRIQRRQAWGTGVGIVGVTGVVVTAMALSHSSGQPSGTSAQPVTTQAAVGAQPTTQAPPTTSATTTVAPGTTTAQPSLATLDVDADGRPDTATTRFVNRRTAQLVVHLDSGKTLTSKAFALYKQGGAGKIFAVSLSTDRRSELLVSDPGADGIGYHLFQARNGTLVEVPAPHGQQAPYLYIGGGMYYSSSFGCAGRGLVVTKEQPAVKSTASLPADPPFRVTTTVYALSGGSLKATHSSTVRVANRGRAQAQLAKVGNQCGTRP